MLISFQLALQVHCRALWQLPSQNSVPPKVTLTDRARYNSRFSSESAIKSSVHASLDANSVDINEAQSRVRQLLDSLVDLNSTTANHIQRIDENFLRLMFRTVSFFGLAHWAPDVLSQDPNSMYNLLHEHIALVTFEQVAAGFGYSHLGIDLSLIHNFVLMRKLYRNFVYSYMHGIAKSENKTPGSVAKSKAMTNVWKRRKEVFLYIYYFYLQLAHQWGSSLQDEFVS